MLAPPFSPGTYSADVSCTLRAVVDAETAGEEPFDSSITLVIDSDGLFMINGEAVVVGGTVLRAIPTADLAFEVIEVLRSGSLVTVRYEPRPTLPGITVQGELIETYRWLAGTIEMTARADLELTDISSTTGLTVDCQGVLASP